MADAMAHSRKPQVSGLLPQKDTQVLNCPIMAEAYTLTPGLFPYDRAIVALRNEMWRRKQRFDLAAES